MRAIESGILEGKIIAGGIAQSVTRDGDLVHVRLTYLRGSPPTAGSITFPEPVTVQAGQALVVEVDRSCTTPPFIMREHTVATCLYLSPQ